jgi:hypothetical protein
LSRKILLNQQTIGQESRLFQKMDANTQIPSKIKTLNRTGKIKPICMFPVFFAFFVILSSIAFSFLAAQFRVGYKGKVKILITLGHPDPESFNHDIASSVYDAIRHYVHHVTLHDLYAEAFDPLLPVQEIPERGTIPARCLYGITRAYTANHIEENCRLFREYESFLAVDFCFQGFEDELTDLPGQYAHPDGALLIAVEGQTAGGCVAL